MVRLRLQAAHEKHGKQSDKLSDWQWELLDLKPSVQKKAGLGKHPKAALLTHQQSSEGCPRGSPP